MNRVPTEIFQYLLTIISEEIRNGAEPWSVYTCLFQLRLVSTTWMVAIDSHPPLWTLLTTRHGEQLFWRAHERSRMLPLHIDLWCPASTDPMRYLNAIAKLASRWLSLHVAWEYRSAWRENDLKSLLLTPAPQLRTASFTRFDRIAQSVHLFDGVAPRLQTVIMDRSSPNWKSLLTWDLKRLVIRWMERAEEKAFEGLIQVVSASPSLEELELVGWSERIPIEGVPPVQRVIPSDRLRKLRLRQFPWQWAVSFLETIRIPNSCISDIFLDVSIHETQVDAALRLMKRELAQAATVAISLLAQGLSQIIKLACVSTAASRTEVKFTGSRHMTPNNAEFQGWSGVQGLKPDIQNIDVPVNLYVTCPEGNEAFRSIMEAADPLLPSVTKVTLDESSLSLFVKHSDLSRFTNLSELEIKNVNAQKALNDAAKWILGLRSNVMALKTVTLTRIDLPTAVIKSFSNTLKGKFNLNWT
ncbi:hypothetical protein FS837_011477 [Tulasnella sp. UAMH 9824]|nr:hypothetical protein FS837_011477 [Tulasnella sp. UAMH 9824]